MALNKETISKIQEITLAGYPYKVNLDKYKIDKKLDKEEHVMSSLFFNHLYGQNGSVHCINESVSSFITYKVPTGMGISGSGIITNMFNRPILIALHKGKYLE